MYNYAAGRNFSCFDPLPDHLLDRMKPFRDDQEKRFKTFENWTCEHVTPDELSTDYMFYTGYSDVVQCSFCGTKIKDWEKGDSVVARHNELSSMCPLVVKRLTAFFPKYALYSERIKSFMINDFVVNTARLNMPKDFIRIAADAGFFYQGISSRDSVKCYYCGGGLNDFNYTDDIATEHDKNFGKCPYNHLKKHPGGGAPQDSIIAGRFAFVVNTNPEDLNAPFLPSCGGDFKGLGRLRQQQQQRTNQLQQNQQPSVFGNSNNYLGVSRGPMFS